MLNRTCNYFHAIDGRLRIKVPEVKNSRVKAAEVEIHLRSLPAVTRVDANSTTGNVLVLYDSQRMRQDQLLEALRSLGCYRQASQASAEPTETNGAVSRPLVGQVALAAVGLLFQTVFRLAVSKLS